ncbi:peptidoglycan bridge formation glycyltransferase FemA/FemB family protein [Candidatus Dojkabacteria bacterium]|nr:peptidoglycan bridge formation glycyltransferase FemA/FemB family protein [Candidatus Dojkabacteria bacterium]
MQIKELGKDEYLKFSEELNVHPLQSYSWGELKRPVWEPLRLGVFEAGECLSIFTILTRRIPLVGKKFGYIPRGFSLKNQEYLSKILQKLIGTEYIRSLSFVLIDPEVFQIQNSKFEKIFEIYRSVGFKESGRQEQPIRTVILDLTKSEEGLLADMRSKHRQYIRKAERKGVRIEKEADIEEFCKILSEIIEERGYKMHEIDYYRKVWELFREEGKAEMFIAKAESEAIGAYMLIFTRDGCYEMYGGAPERGKEYYGNYALKWESVKYAKSIGKKYYDQWGAEFIHPGLKQFKEGFGGQVVEYPSQCVYVNDGLEYLMYKVMRKIDRIRRG